MRSDDTEHLLDSIEGLAMHGARWRDEGQAGTDGFLSCDSCSKNFAGYVKLNEPPVGNGVVA